MECQRGTTHHTPQRPQKVAQIYVSLHIHIPCTKPAQHHTAKSRRLTAKKSCSFMSISSFCSTSTDADDSDFDVAEDDFTVTLSVSAGGGGGFITVSVAATNFCQCCCDAGFVSTTATMRIYHTASGAVVKLILPYQKCSTRLSNYFSKLTVNDK